ncbi:MAG: hypothetical protein PHI53_01210 [Candidatus Pacebacteria bacterium]|nr:hypothetical protein [Candidatus Paceibacterota bacterium]
MLKILGILDVSAAILLAGIALNIEAPHELLIFITAYLFIKALIFILDIGSALDAFSGLMFLLSFFTVVPPFILYTASALLAVKGLMSISA